ncbi:MAG: DUF2339 domain-containing protein [Acidobacteria bacterium]|nr:DUF2339 domain-containing protein [Acidobacteriota bacterium]MBS1866304.1 DUF2339 domain-containing protein [Acidobacteriota bacterium]
MEAPLILLFVLLGVLLIVGPILGILAYLGVRRLESLRQPVGVQDLTARIYALEQRLARLEKEPAPVAPREPASTLSPGSNADPKPAPPPVTVPQAPAPPKLHEVPPPPSLASFAPPPLHASLGKDSDSGDLETVIAGRWFMRIGMVALLFAISYFLKLAFDNNWIGPSGRVAIGILLGSAMMPWSSWLLGRGYSYFSEGIVALGEATLFLSVWAGCQYYHLYSQDVGFIGMIVITAAMAAISLGRDSQRIAVLCLLGGYATPMLVSTGQDHQVVLFTYLLILGAGMLVMGERKDWPSLQPIAYIGTQIYFWGWYDEFYNRTGNPPLERTVIFATLFFLLFAALPVLRAIKEGVLKELDILVTTINSFVYVGTLFVLFWPKDRWPFTLLVLALAAAHIGVARAIPDREKEKTPLARYIFAGLGLTFATMAIPIRLEGKWITFCFAVEGAVLIWSGFKAASGFLRQFGYLLLAIAAVRVLILPPPGGTFLLNQRFAAYLLVIACFGVALWSAREHLDETGDQEKTELGIYSVLINVFALIALSLEFWDYFGTTTIGMDIDHARHLSLSVLWTVYASALIFLGWRQKSAPLRWQALTLFGLVVVKVFLFDLASLDRAYRILSFLVLGSVLMAVSFLYSKRAAKGRTS